MPIIVNKKEKKEMILEAAISVFAKKGMSKSTMSDIAEAAQIGKGTIYEYFQSKDEMVWAAFHYVIKKAEDLAALRLSQIKDPLEKLRAYFRVWKEIMQTEFKENMEIILDFWAEGLRNKEGAATFNLKKIYHDNRDMLKHILDGCVAQNKIYAVDTLVVSSIILGAMDGLMLQWIVDPELFTVDESLDELEDLILRGLKRKG